MSRGATRIVRIDPRDKDLDSHPAILEAAAVLRGGDLVAFPTETVYGLGGDASSESAVAAIYAAKERPADNPLIAHVASLSMVSEIAHLDSFGERGQVDKLLSRFWPGPLTVVLPARRPVLPATRGLDSVAVRMPDHPIALALIAAADVPVAAPSANRSSWPSPTRAEHVSADLDGRLPLILDGGPCQVGIESTVLDLTGDGPAILRPGVVSAAQIEAALERPVSVGEGSVLRRSPGTRYRHYSPKAPVILIGESISDETVLHLISGLRRRAQAKPIGYLGTRGGAPTGASAEGVEFKDRSGDGEADGLTYHLYDDLRAFDAAGAAVILVELGGDEGVRDRLRRASSLTVDSEPDSESIEAALALVPAEEL